MTSRATFDGLTMDEYLYKHTSKQLLETKGLLDVAGKRNTELELALYLTSQKLAKAEADHLEGSTRLLAALKLLKDAANIIGQLPERAQESCFWTNYDAFLEEK